MTGARQFAVTMASNASLNFTRGGALYSIVETAKAYKIDPYQYLRLILTELPKIPEGGRTARGIVDRLPYFVKASST